MVLFPDYFVRIMSNELHIKAQRDGRMLVNEHSLFLEHLSFLDSGQIIFFNF